jgi:hypothetical protein
MKSEGKINSKRAQKKRVTWTFQPDEDILVAVLALNSGKELSRGQRTELIKKALEHQYPEAFLAMAKRRYEEARATLEQLSGKVGKDQIGFQHPPSSRHDDDRRAVIGMVEEEHERQRKKRQR